ncbi:SigE family RNA polymerase sigma factor [Promicromonospora sp. NPDC057488]|uniref:SigE family RNA polymerase sigma factor n=1 Tax=Promicromonospora sp. NPDC057488 TaxID=3346147 RepID=UPI00366F9654
MTTDDPRDPTAPSDGGGIRVVTTGSTAVEEFTRFAEASTARLHRIAVMLCGDEHRAHDLVQVALERTYRAWDRVGDGEPFAYARRVIATARIDTWRRTRRDVTADPHQLRGATVADATETLLHRDELVRALHTLPAAQRRAVVLRHILDQTEAQTAAELGISVGAVKSATSRGLARLRGVLDGTIEAPAVPASGSTTGESRAMAQRAVRHERRRRAVLVAGAAALVALLVVAGLWAGLGTLRAEPVPPAQLPSGQSVVWDDPPLYEPLVEPPASWTEETVGRLRLAVPESWDDESTDQAGGQAAWVDGPTAVPFDRAELNVYNQAERYPWDRAAQADVTRVDVAGAASVLVVREDLTSDTGEPVFSVVVEVVLDGGGVYVLEYTAPDDGEQEQRLGTVLGSLAVAPS